jgi:uncharacterized protein YxeA
MNKKVKILIAVVIFIILGLLYLDYRKHQGKNVALEAARKDVAVTQAKLKGSEAHRQLIQQEYDKLIGKLKSAAAKKISIKPPADEHEARERFKKLGYPPKAAK